MAYRAGCGERKRTQEKNKLTHGGIKNPTKQASRHTRNPINRSTCSNQISGYCFLPFAGRCVWQNPCIQFLCAFAEPPQKNALQKSSEEMRKEELEEKRQGIAPEQNAPDGRKLCFGRNENGKGHRERQLLVNPNIPSTSTSSRPIIHSAHPQHQQ